MLMRLDVSWSGITSFGLDVAAGECNGVKHSIQLVSGVFERQEAAGEDRFEGALGEGVRDQSRMAATRHEARGAAREPDGGTPGRPLRTLQ